MEYSLANSMVIGVSARALFDMRKENSIFEQQGLEAYTAYQKEHEDEILKQGPAFALIKALLQLNELTKRANRVEIILMSRNNPDVSLRIFHSIEHYRLKITRSVFLSGAPLTPYLKAFRTDLFLSACEEDVQAAVDAGIAAGIICEEKFSDKTIRFCGEEVPQQIKIAFDGDAVLFSDEAERVYREQGLEAFENSEREKAAQPLHAGPFARFLKLLSDMQKEFDMVKTPIRTALVTARSAPAHERVIRTLRAWNVRIDEAFFLGGVTKREVLSAFGAQIFFDDQQIHTNEASEVVPAARVPIRSSVEGSAAVYRLERRINEVS